MKAKPYRLLVVAHPDDETIFFAGALLQKREMPWKVICLTDGNADGRGAERRKEFQAACRLFGVRDAEQWSYQDRFGVRLPVDEISARLLAFPPPFEIYTHGPLGEYGHAHHQDACLAVHRAFPRKRIFSPAWNCVADFVIQLTPAQFKKKTFAFAEIYSKEVSRFLNILPSMPVEGFRRFRLAEVEAMAGFMKRERAFSRKEIPDFSWAEKMLPELRDKIEKRLF